MCHSVQGRVSVPAYITGHMIREGSLHPGESAFGGGVCIQGGSPSKRVYIQGGLHWGGGQTHPGQRADGTHPTGMHSCLFKYLQDISPIGGATSASLWD